LRRNQTNITVQVQPSARRNEVLGFEEGVLKVKIAAPPVKGRANRELIEFLSQLLKVSKSSITLEKGATSRRKVISISGLSQAEVSKRLAAQFSTALKSEK
jgi:hypothetical protein